MLSVCLKGATLGRPQIGAGAYASLRDRVRAAGHVITYDVGLRILVDEDGVSFARERAIQAYHLWLIVAQVAA
jgi:hypothetical protein